MLRNINIYVMNIKMFNEFTTYTEEELDRQNDGGWLDEEDVILCICDLLDEGFIFDYQITDGGSYSGEICLYKNQEYPNKVLRVINTVGENKQELRAILPDDQKRIYDMIEIAVGKLQDVSGVKYSAQVDFAKFGTFVDIYRGN